VTGGPRPRPRLHWRSWLTCPTRFICSRSASRAAAKLQACAPYRSARADLAALAAAVGR